MKNLNKYTKAELISKFKNLENNNSNNNPNNTNIFSKIIKSILLFKSIILKLTLITFLVRWIKKYSLIQKIWHVFNLIASTLVGFSLFDIYSYDVIEWIKSTQIYNYIYEFFNYKPPVDENIIEERPMKDFKTTNRSQTITESKIRDSEGNSRNSWNYREFNEQEIENNTNYIKIAIASIIIIGCFCWFYSDEITTGYMAFKDWWNSRGNNDPGTGSNVSITPTQDSINRDSIQDRIKSKIRNYEITNQNQIELIDNTQNIAGPSNLDKGKGVLTSPSLEDLNNKAKESWADFSKQSESGLNSPTSSTSSTETITQNSFTSSSEILVDRNFEKTVKFVNKTWKGVFADKDIVKFNDIERSVDLSLLDNIQTRYRLADDLIELTKSYDYMIEVYNKLDNNQEKVLQKIALFKFREWMNKYSEIIVGTNINVGSPNDEPLIFKDLVIK